MTRSTRSRSTARRLLGGGAAAALVAATVLLVTPMSASAAGVGDTSAAVLYDPTGPIGSVLTALSDHDDDATTIPAPFPINFFGTKYDYLCVSTNGTVTPVANAGDGCSDDYDVSLAEFASEDGGHSVIGALLADNDPSETLWKSQSTTLTSVVATGGVATFTTAGPHGYAVGDRASVFFHNDPNFGTGLSDFNVLAVTATTFDVNWGGPDFAVMPATGDVGIPYSDTADDSNSDGLADDGFGDVKSVYAGATTFNGQPAFAITWYRVPTNDRVNSGLKSNTYQLVFVQDPTATGATTGYDFTVQFNFGTLTDDNDGYDPTDPTGSSSCDSSNPVTCRWSVGWAQWDAVNNVAIPFELFANAPVSDIVDPGSTPLVGNSLNSSVLGRYTFAMANGVTVGFSIPVLGAGPAPVTPAAPSLAATGVDETIAGLGAVTLLLAGGILMLLRRRSARQI